MVERLINPEWRELGLGRLVALAHQHLAFDVVFVVELTADGLVCRAVAGDANAFNITPEGHWPGQSPDAGALVSSEIANVIRDAHADDRVARLPMVGTAQVGSFIGVPLRLSDGTLWGTFCCLSHEPDLALGEHEVRFMSALAELVVDELDHRAVERRVRGDILALIDAETVEVAYQPIFDLSDNRCLGVEALARFPEPFEETERTFAIAEQLGLGFRLEELVVRKAWDLQSRLGRGQFLALNLTPESLLELAKRANQRLDIELSSVVVEITEHRAIEAYSDLRKQLKRLRARGLRIAVDDVGAGYASLRHVLELRPDIVKVDRWLIDGLAGDCARKVAVSSFVSLARNLGSLVVAEGVERPADREAARELGLHAAQGYLLARPSSNPDDLSSWTRGTTTPTRAIASNSARRRPPRRQQTRRPKALAGS